MITQTTTRVRRDRPRTALTLLAAAGPDGLTTPELITQAGEGHIGARYSWYGNTLRTLEGRNHVRELRRESGGWQHGQVIRWAITDAGIAKLADYDRIRDQHSARAAKREKTAARSAAKTARQPVIEAAAKAVAEKNLTPDEKYILTATLRASGCTYKEIADVFGMSREWIRIVLDQQTWHAHAQNKRDAR